MLKNNVLRKDADFDNVYKRGRSVGERYVVVFYIKNHRDINRTCFLASKKVGNSVRRNRARRLMRESYRLMKDRLPAGYDMIIIARNTITGRKFFEVDKSIRNAFKRAGLLKDK
jgi:ribonuclease P protein component